MRFDDVEPPTEGAGWKLSGPCGELLELPSCNAGRLQIGLLGTRTTLVKSGKYRACADLLDHLDCAIMILDIRRSGSGGNGAWAGQEWETSIPAMKTNNKPYAYYHLPMLSPTTALLNAYRKASRMPEVLNHEDIKEAASGIARGEVDLNDLASCASKHWQVFREQYIKDLPAIAVNIGRAFVEAANAVGGLPIFLCAEEYLSHFDAQDQGLQDERYCHRYSIAHLVTANLQSAPSGVHVHHIHLRIGLKQRGDS